MALAVVEPDIVPAENKEELPPLPPVLTTPVGDPWPRPYFLHDGLRRVAPYHYTYNTYCKERWRGREILDVFATEFRDRSPAYYKSAIENGQVLINGQRIHSPSTKLKNGDIITHTLHRHEPPVTAEPISIVHEDDDLIVINKPAGIPVHPSGRYNWNSVTEIMRAERNPSFKALPCNRLDRLTSGVMFIGKHRAAADAMTVAIRKRTVRKEYLARVVGEFPAGTTACDKAILQISPRLGLNQVRANGKAARTVFRRVAYYPPAPSASAAEAPPAAEPPAPAADALPWRAAKGYSVVHCLPLTGRTHQIRVHLQWLGHPIANDPIYANQRVFGPNLELCLRAAHNDNAAGIAADTVLARLERMGKEEVADAVAYRGEIGAAYQARKAERMSGEACGVCGTELYSDPGAHELGIFLHALRYADREGAWCYETRPPAWARPPEGVEGEEGLLRRLRELGEGSDALVEEFERLEVRDEGRGSGEAG